SLPPACGCASSRQHNSRIRAIRPDYGRRRGGPRLVGRRATLPLPTMRTPDVPRFAARRATWSRSVGLLRSFPDEQGDPDRFYRDLATDTVDLVADLWRAMPGAGASRSARLR